MTILADVSSGVQYLFSTGANYPVPWRVFDASELTVEVNDAGSIYYPSFTVTNLGKPNALVQVPGTPSSYGIGTTVTIFPNVGATQPVNLRGQSNLDPEVLEAALDRATLVAARARHDGALALASAQQAIDAAGDIAANAAAAAASATAAAASATAADTSADAAEAALAAMMFDRVRFRGNYAAVAALVDLARGDLYSFNANAVIDGVQYYAGDHAIYNGSAFERFPGSGGSGGVSSVAGLTGDVSTLALKAALAYTASDVGAVSSVAGVSGPSISAAALKAALALTSADVARSVQSITSATTITPVATNDVVIVGALTVGTTIANPSGTYAAGQGFVIKMKSAAAQTLAFGAKYRGFVAALPTSTVAGKWMKFACDYNSTDDMWDVTVQVQA